MSMRDFTDWLLEQHDPAQVLRLVDIYIQTLSKVGNKFVLPKEHIKLKPAIEAFAHDSTAFVEFLKAVRDNLVGNVRDDVHGVYRTILTRYMQASRRERMNRALVIHEKNHGKVNYVERLAFFKAIEQTWAKERLEFMAKHRYGKTRLSTDERNEVLQEFWSMIDERISKGEIPNVGNATVES